MGLLNPDVGGSKPFSDVVPDGAFFVLQKIEIARNIRTDYGEGEMVIMDIAFDGEDHRVSVWGRYLLEQARAVAPSDLGKRYRLIQAPVEGYSRRDVKQLIPEGAEDIPF